jgi:hypothetical protein
MNYRLFTTLSAAAAAVALLSLAPVPAVGQAPAKKAAPKAYTAPKTPWGDPDLQGVWPGNMGVPMQRPANMGERTTLNDDEYKQRVEAASKQSAADRIEQAPDNSKVGIGPPSYWTERGKPSRQTSLIIDPPNGRLPPQVPDAADRRKQARGGKGVTGEWRGEADSFDDMNIYYRCVTRGLLGSVIPVVYNNGNQIVQAPGYVVFRNEMIHEARVIPLNGGPHLNPTIKSYMGDSRGHWEGNTLVVETTNINDKAAIGSNGAGYPGDPGYASEALKVTERFTRVAEDMIEYKITVDDPKTWTRPWTMMLELQRNNEYQFLEYACHEGNYAMFDILSGARQDDKSKATKQAR